MSKQFPHVSLFPCLMWSGWWPTWLKVVEWTKPAMAVLLQPAVMPVAGKQRWQCWRQWVAWRQKCMNYVTAKMIETRSGFYIPKGKEILFIFVSYAKFGTICGSFMAVSICLRRNCRFRGLKFWRFIPWDPGNFASTLQMVPYPQEKQATSVGKPWEIHRMIVMSWHLYIHWGQSSLSQWNPHEIPPKEERQNPPKWIDTYINLSNQSSYWVKLFLCSPYYIILHVYIWSDICWTKSPYLNMAIEIVDFPIKHGDFPVRYC